MDEFCSPELDGLEESLLALVKPELQPGERLLWASRGGAGSTRREPLLLTAGWVWLVGSIVVFLACLAPILSRVISGNRFAIPDLVFVGLILSSFVIVLCLIIVLSRRSGRESIAREVYALTDRRAIIWLPKPFSAIAVHTFQPGTIRAEELHRVERRDGSGDVVFRRHFIPTGFREVANVRRVEELVRRFLVIPGQGPELRFDPDLDSP